MHLESGIGPCRHVPIYKWGVVEQQQNVRGVNNMYKLTKNS